jgi:hypothetical protein
MKHAGHTVFLPKECLEFGILLGFAQNVVGFVAV